MKTLLLVSYIILAVNAYQFDDAIYNQYLSKDFESLADDEEITILNHRARRETEDPKCHHKHHHHHHLCCGAEDLEALHNELRDIKKECFKEVTGKETFHGKPFDPFNCDDIEQRKKEMICVKQCVGKKKNAVDEEGNLKEDVIKKYVTEHTSMEWLKPKLDDMLTKCFAEAKEAGEKTDKSDKNACNPAHIKFQHCMFRETQLACPEDKIEDPKTCEIVRQFAKHSSFFPHPPH
ncbi:uncharacterized protein [Onthophagus taurus]|uniref:uncharacterized protein n=1 Tax=Onthophagus taurus TaxID=166361 RepID=UPI000C203886|nr:uncharacterized protein LOC111424289 [Onthophagus taurus]